MMALELIDDHSKFLKDVISLWRTNSQWLGFYPEGAFQMRASRRNIIIEREGENLRGYLLFYKTDKRIIKITHLCVNKDYRGQGISRKLINFLLERSKEYNGIGLYCRRDYAIWPMWMKFGFIAINEKQGRGEDKAELTYFWRENPHPNLFDHDRSVDESKVDVVIDANVFYDLHNSTRNEAEESRGLIADWISPLIRLNITDELFNEIQRHCDPKIRSEYMKYARLYDKVDPISNDIDHIVKKLHAILTIQTNIQDESDIRHLSRTIDSKCTIFITRDKKMLDISSDIYKDYGLRITRPAEFIGEFENMINENLYQRERLVGTELIFSRHAKIDNKIVDLFIDPSGRERLTDLRKTVRNYIANPDIYKCYIVSEKTDCAEKYHHLLLYVTENLTSQICRVPLFRLSRFVRGRRIANTLKSTLLNRIINDSIRDDKRLIIYEDKVKSDDMNENLDRAGFIKMDSSWIKISIRVLEKAEKLSNLITSILDNLLIECDDLRDLATILRDREINAQALTAWQIEHLIWPAKILNCQIPNYIIPIKRKWASDLFDSNLSKKLLFCANTDLALNPDSIYYRSVKNGPKHSFGRILWYISEIENDHDTKQIRACSRLSDRQTGEAIVLFNRFKRLGVYEWSDILALTNNDPYRNIMALRFDDTELFSHPIRWKDINSVMEKHNRKSTFQSPVEINEELFSELYRRGFNL